MQKIKIADNNLFYLLKSQIETFYRKNNPESLKSYLARTYNNTLNEQDLIHIEKLYLKDSNIKLDSCTINDQSINILKFLKNLKSITIINCPNMAGINLDDIPYKFQLKNLTISDKSIETLDLTNFSNLETLKITNCPNLKEIKGIERLTKLKNIQLYECNSLKEIDVTSLHNLKNLSLVECKVLEKIKGINSLNELSNVEIYGNEYLNEIEIAKFLINQSTDTIINADVLYFLAIRRLVKGKYMEHIEKFKEINWYEPVGAGAAAKKIKYNTREVAALYSKLQTLCDKIIPFEYEDDLEIIYSLYDWITRNVSYDTQGRDSNYRMFVQDNLSFGKKGGTNSVFNAVHQNSVVCEGYTRIFQHMLKLYGIEAFNSLTYAGTERNNNTTLNGQDLKNNFQANHSIIKIKYDNHYYYCDTTWAVNHRTNDEYFMMLPENFNPNYHPVFENFEYGAPQISVQTKKELREKIKGKKQQSKSKDINRIMEKYNLNLISIGNRERAEECERKLEIMEDLFLLGIITFLEKQQISSLMTSQLYSYYNNLSTEKEEARKL